MARKGENIYKRKDGRWEGRYIKDYCPNGKARYGYVYGHSYAEVRAKKLRALKNSGTEPVQEKDPGSFETALDLWLVSEQISVKASIYALYLQLVERHIRPALEKRHLSELNTAAVEGYAAELLQEGRLDGKGGLSPKTVTDILTIIKQVISYARKLGLPSTGELGKIVIKRQVREMRVFSVGEQEKLKDFFLADIDLTKFGVYLSLYTGLRLGEVCALKWENLSLDRKVLEVRHTLQRVRLAEGDKKTKLIVTEPKSQCSIRDIPLPQTLVDVARKFQGQAEAYVLTGTAEKPVEPRKMQYRFKRYITVCGLAPANFHALRHTFATRCVELGFEIKTLSEILGHANVNITLDRYVHSSFELKRENMFP